MKKADLEKLKGRKIIAGTGTTNDRYGKGAGEVVDKREQRERDREQGLVPFAVKLHSDLVRDLHAAAAKRGVGLNELTAELLRKGLAAK
jgi:hypothetical protein